MGYIYIHIRHLAGGNGSWVSPGYQYEQKQSRSSLIQTLTVGLGVSPNQPYTKKSKKVRGLYRR